MDTSYFYLSTAQLFNGEIRNTSSHSSLLFLKHLEDTVVLSTVEDPVRKSDHISGAGLGYCSINKAYSYTLSNVEKSNDTTIEELSVLCA